MLVAIHERPLRALLVDRRLRLEGAQLRLALGSQLVPSEDVEREPRVGLGATHHARAEHLLELRRGLVEILDELDEALVARTARLHPIAERAPWHARGPRSDAQRGADAAGADDGRGDLGREGRGAGHQETSRGSSPSAARRSSATATYFGASSMARQRRPVCSAATSVVPEPLKGS